MAEAKKTAKPKNKKTDEPKEKQIKHAEVVAEAAPADNVPEAKIEIQKVTSKAGKHSAKSVREDEQKQAKAARKTGSAEKPAEAKTATKPPRSKADRAGKKYKAAYKLVDNTRVYTLAEAVDLAIKTATTKFDSSVEVHVNLGVDPKQADQNVRDTVALPAGTGKTVRIEVLSTDAEAEKLFAKLDKEELDFDVLFATPAMMPRLGKYARLLGPRGLMPNPKSGTVTQNVSAAAEEAKAGKVEYRVDQSGIVHLSIGKVSFGQDKLMQNVEAVLSSIRAAKPASLKGIYIKSIFLTTTMGPSIKTELAA